MLVAIRKIHEFKLFLDFIILLSKLSFSNGLEQNGSELCRIVQVQKHNRNQWEHDLRNARRLIVLPILETCINQ